MVTPVEGEGCEEEGASSDVRLVSGGGWALSTDDHRSEFDMRLRPILRLLQYVDSQEVNRPTSGRFGRVIRRTTLPGILHRLPFSSQAMNRIKQ